MNDGGVRSSSDLQLIQSAAVGGWGAFRFEEAPELERFTSGTSVTPVRPANPVVRVINSRVSANRS